MCLFGGGGALEYELTSLVNPEHASDVEWQQWWSSSSLSQQMSLFLCTWEYLPRKQGQMANRVHVCRFSHIHLNFSDLKWLQWIETWYLGEESFSVRYHLSFAIVFFWQLVVDFSQFFLLINILMLFLESNLTLGIQGNLRNALPHEMRFLFYDSNPF